MDTLNVPFLNKDCEFLAHYINYIMFYVLLFQTVVIFDIFMKCSVSENLYENVVI